MFQSQALEIAVVNREKHVKRYMVLILRQKKL